MKFSIFYRETGLVYVLLASLPSLEGLCVRNATYSALEDFYLSLNGSKWSWTNVSNAWNFSSAEDPCLDEWEGVSCQACNVTGISLINTNLQGQIPYSLSNLVLLQSLDLSYNYISGKVPEIFSQMFNLSKLAIEGNLLTSTLPTSINNLSSLLQINFRDNEMIGPLHTKISSLGLKSYLVDRNMLTGTIPTNAFSPLNQLEYFSLWRNKLTGTVSASLANMKSCQYFAIDENPFVGTLPSELGDIPALVEFWVNDCDLVGTLPKGLSLRENLQLVMAQKNSFTGTLDGLFNPAVQTQLMRIDVSNNKFSGQLPENIFQLPALSTFAAVSNCFSGTIPSSICSMTSLENLVLDGLSTASGCQTSSSFLGIPIPLHMDGSLPSCLWKLPQLVTFHAAGNGFLGQVPNDAFNATSTLRDVVVNRNKLTGTLPSAMFQVPFTSFDLSFNKINGVLHFPSLSESVNQNIDIQVNRLSGQYDASILATVENLQMFEGNLFSCRKPNQLKLENDPYYDESTTHCGSFQYNFSLIFYACVTVAFLMAPVLVHMLPKHKREIVKGSIMRTYQYARELIAIRNDIRTTAKIQKSGDDKNTRLSEAIDDLTYVCGLGDIYFYVLKDNATIGIIVIGFITVAFPALKSTLTTGYYEQYTWVWSVTLSFGSTASILLCFTWLGVVIISVNSTYTAHNAVALDDKVYHEEKKRSTLPWRQSLQRRFIKALKYSCIGMPHICIITATNILYVYLKSIVASKTEFFFVELFLVAFDLAWLNIVVSRSVSYANDRLQMDMKKHHMIALQSYISIYTTVIGPMIASAISDSNCFSDAFRTIPTVTSTYPFEFCGKFDEVLFSTFSIYMYPPYYDV